jgi:hypothetical protein
MLATMDRALLALLPEKSLPASRSNLIAAILALVSTITFHPFIVLRSRWTSSPWQAILFGAITIRGAHH